MHNAAGSIIIKLAHAHLCVIRLQSLQEDSTVGGGIDWFYSK